MIETLLYLLIVVAIVALVLSFLPIDSRVRGVVWLIVLLLIIAYLFPRFLP